MTDADAAAHLARRGLVAMRPELALAALGQALDGAEQQLTVADVDWERFAASFTAWRPSPLIGDLPEVRQALARTADTPAGAASDSALARRLAGPKWSRSSC